MGRVSRSWHAEHVCSFPSQNWVRQRRPVSCMPPLLKIEISSNGQNCSILSQKVPKFELYKHNDELFNIYYGIFYELWIFSDFDRLCKLEKRGDEILKKSSPLKLLSQSQPNFAVRLWQPSWSVFWNVGHNFGRGPLKNHFSKVWLRLAQ
jgi:hypothetical protein